MNRSAYLKWKNQFIHNAKLTKTPILAMFELTSRCNLDCKMCYVHNQDNKCLKERELGTEEWIDIFDQAYQNGLFFATLTGGECLIRKDFKELYLHLWNRGVKVSVLTNGTMIDNQYLEFFQQYPPEYIQISVYGSNDENYQNVTGQKMFSRVIWAIERLVESNIDARIAITPSRYLYDDYSKIVEICKNKGFKLANNEMFLYPNRDDPSKDDYYLSENEIIHLCVEKELVYERTLVEKLSAPDTGTPCEGPADFGLSCTAGNCRTFVSWEGKMYPCLNIMIGGFSAKDYAGAWKKTTEVANAFINAKECVECAYKNVCPKCPAMRISDFSTGKCNTSLCYMTREKYRLGIIEHL